MAAPAGVSFAAVSAGAGHTCGITAAGVAYCWGRTSFGNLDIDAASRRSTPRLVAAPTGVRCAALSAGGDHSCGVTAAGAAYCWGSNPRGQLGDGTTTERLTPVRVQ
jgi:alpha-tubulin suppressor-like RCC1 family protein